jgi:sec-independent protein translocase protein TatB
MHFGDSIFIFLLALVLFGPKKLPEIGRQVGKLLAEFRRASNEFKFQIQEELRNMEEEERRKKLAEYDAQHGRVSAAVAEMDENATPTILPPVKSMAVSSDYPFAKPDMPQPGETEAASGSTETEAPAAEAAAETTSGAAPEATAGPADASPATTEPAAAEAAETNGAGVPDPPVKEMAAQEAAQASQPGLATRG